MGNHHAAISVAARVSLLEAKKLLRTPSPSNVEGSLPHLRAAIEALERLQAGAASAGDEETSRRQLRLEVVALQREVAQVNALLHHAGRFHLGWATFLSCPGSEYSASGQVFPKPDTRRITIEG